MKKKYGHRFEVLNSVKDKEAVGVIQTRLLRSYPNHTVIEWYKAERKPMSAETKKKISDSKMGRPRDEATRLKISLASKGRSNFQGKKHSEESKEKIAEAKIGNQHVTGKYWAHDPRSTKEARVVNRHRLPFGFQLGRDYYSTEPGLYHFKNRQKKWE